MEAEAKYLAYSKKDFEEKVGFGFQLVSGMDIDMYELLSIVMDEKIENWDDYVVVSKEQQADDLEEEYGEYKIEVSVKKEKKLTVEELMSEKQKFINNLEKNGLIDAKKITDAEIITVKAKIKGENKTETKTSDVYMCKVNGLWKVLLLG